MGRREAIAASPIAIHHMHHFGQWVVEVAWPEACHHWPDDAGGDLVASKDKQGHGHQPKQRGLERIVAYDDIQQAGIEVNPHVLGTIQWHEHIPE